MQIICTECGRTITEEFIFCPWCGIKRSVAMQSDVEILMQESGRLEKFRRVEQQRRIKHMSRTLDNLEKDLSALALSEEMHK